MLFFRDGSHEAADTDVGGRCCEVSGNDLDRGRTISAVGGDGPAAAHQVSQKSCNLL